MIVLITTDAGDLLIAEDGRLLIIEFTAAIDVAGRFTVMPRETEFITLPRETEFTALPRKTKFTVLPRITKFYLKG